MLAALASVFVAGFGGPSTGEALRLDWEAPAACPQAQAVREAVDLNLGRESFGPELDTVAVRGVVVAVPDAWQLRVEVELPAGSVHRDVASPDCAELAAAAGLIIAVALDPLRAARTVHASPTADAASTGDDVESAPISTPAPPVATPAARRRVDVDLRVGGLAEFGTLSLLRGGVLAGVGVVGRGYRVDASLQYWAPRRVRPFDVEPSAGVAVQQAGVGARACLVPTLESVEVASCLGFETGAAWARGIGVGQPRTTAVPWAAVVARQELAWTSRRRVGLFVGVDAMLHVVRPRFRVGGLGVAARTRWVGVRVVAGPSVRL